MSRVSVHLGSSAARHSRRVALARSTRPRARRPVGSRTIGPVTDIRLLHNPKCSKSRGALDHLQSQGADLEVIRYLDTPPTRAELEHIVDHLDVEPGELVRKDAHFKELGLDPADYTTRDAVIDLLVEHPRLMERPIAIKGDVVVLGRPPEKVLALLED